MILIIRPIRPAGIKGGNKGFGCREGKMQVSGFGFRVSGVRVDELVKSLEFDKGWLSKKAIYKA
ncbi:MAG: hypothetical protein JRD93_06590 [Deltaproteobacteria bacterium]|nr:hypothetical protein [Deltaproteobacteria bacterium]